MKKGRNAMILYGLKNCDTCRKALKSLQNVALKDVRADGVPADILNAAYAQFGADLLNVRSTTWRGLSAEEREKPHLELLKSHPTLMKRPLIQVDDMLYLGWKSDVQTALIG